MPLAITVYMRTCRTAIALRSVNGPGDTIGQVGSTGALAKGNHLHYSILPASAGKDIESPNLPHDGGPIGIRVNEANTIDPAKYDPQPYLVESQRASQMMSGVDDKSALPEDIPFAPKRRFDIPFSTVTDLPAGKPSLCCGWHCPAGFSRHSKFDR